MGGGPGRYAAWLAGLGHRVTLVDPLPLHVEQSSAAAAGRWASLLGDARSLELDDASFDVVLLLGPLYHLVAAADRASALREAAWVLRPGGHLVAAGISRLASLLDGLASGWAEQAPFRAIVEADLRSGEHRNPDGRPEWFTTAYFHRPDELTAELATAGLREVTCVGVEGPAGSSPPAARRRPRSTCGPLRRRSPSRWLRRCPRTCWRSAPNPDAGSAVLRPFRAAARGRLVGPTRVDGGSIGSAAGETATRKRTRSVMMKGLAAVVVESLRAGEAAGCCPSGRQLVRCDARTRRRIGLDEDRTLLPRRLGAPVVRRSGRLTLDDGPRFGPATSRPNWGTGLGGVVRPRARLASSTSALRQRGSRRWRSVTLRVLVR